jgi:G:T-mismatch repair DNA endonuclease (very short patch repair protein)
VKSTLAIKTIEPSLDFWVDAFGRQTGRNGVARKELEELGW